MTCKIGAIPFKFTDKGLSILFVTSQTRERWIFPKGNLKKNESKKKACKREAFEEAGVKGKVLKDLPITVVIGKSRKKKIEQELVTYFPLLVHKNENVWPEIKDRERLWVPLEEAKSIVEDDDFLQLLDWFHDIAPWVVKAIKAKKNKRKNRGSSLKTANATAPAK
jgi:8-oxo-dGTP pyrophosphatase MutT (NUDIX family)